MLQTLMIDGMYLQKGSQYQSGENIGAEEKGQVYRGTVMSMIAVLKNSVPYVIQAFPEVSITG